MGVIAVLAIADGIRSVSASGHLATAQGSDIQSGPVRR